MVCHDDLLMPPLQFSPRRGQSRIFSPRRGRSGRGLRRHVGVVLPTEPAGPRAKRPPHPTGPAETRVAPTAVRGYHRALSASIAGGRAGRAGLWGCATSVPGVRRPEQRPSLWRGPTAFGRDSYPARAVLGWAMPPSCSSEEAVPPGGDSASQCLPCAHTVDTPCKSRTGLGWRACHLRIEGMPSNRASGSPPSYVHQPSGLPGLHYVRCAPMAIGFGLRGARAYQHI